MNTFTVTFLVCDIVTTVYKGCGIFPPIKDAKKTTIKYAAINSTHQTEVSVKYVCNDGYFYTLDNHIVNCTENDFDNKFGNCIKGVLLVGGMKNPNAVQLFSFVSEKWISLPNLSSKRKYHGSVTTKDGIYIVGGFGNKKIDKYNPSTGTFDTVCFMEEYRSDFGVCAFDNENFIFAGGYDDNNVVKTSYIFNIKTNILKQVRDLNVKRYGFALVKSKDGDIIYAIGGGTNGNECLNTIEKFDIKTQTWNNFVTKLKIARRNFQAVAYKNFIYIIGGQLKNMTTTDTIEKFDTITGEIEVIETKLNVARRDFAFAKFKNLVYITGGISADPTRETIWIETNTVEVFNLDLENIQEGKSTQYGDWAFTANIL